MRLAVAEPGDEDAIAALCAEVDTFYGATPAGTPGERAGQVRSVLFGDPPLSRALLAWDGSDLAGFAAYAFLWPAAGLDVSLYLKELYVAEQYRRAGLGARVMTELYRIAAECGCSRVEWTADTDSPGAMAFYEALGVKPVASKIFYRAEVPRVAGPVALPVRVPIRVRCPRFPEPWPVRGLRHFARQAFMRISLCCCPASTERPGNGSGKYSAMRDRRLLTASVMD